MAENSYGKKKTEQITCLSCSATGLFEIHDYFERTYILIVRAIKGPDTELAGKLTQAFSTSSICSYLCYSNALQHRRLALLLPRCPPPLLYKHCMPNEEKLEL